MNRSSISRNVFANLSAYALTLLISFFLSPYIIHRLGDARYGVWAMVGELIGYYGLLDFGIRGAVTYFVSIHTAHDDGEAMRRSTASAFWLLAGIGTLGITAGLAFAFAFPRLFGGGELAAAEVVPAMSVMFVTIGAGLAMEVCTAALIGCRRFDIVNAVEVFSRAISSVGIYFALKAGGGLIALSAMYAAGRLLCWVLMFAAAHSVIPGFSIAPRWFARSGVWKLVSVSSRTVVANLCQLVIARTDLIVVGAFLGVRWVTFYAVGRMLIEYSINICRCVTGVFTPNLTQLYAKGEKAELERLYLAGVKLSGMLAAMLGTGIIWFGKSFIGLWMGKAYVSGALTHRSDVVLLLLIAAALPRLAQSISWQLLLAGGRFTPFMWMNVAEAVTNLGLSVALVHPLGLAGVALGTLIPSVVVQGVVVPWYALRSFGIPVRRYLSQGAMRPLLLCIVMFVADGLLVSARPPASWSVFAAEVAVAGTLGAVLCAGFGLKPEERRHLCNKIAGRSAA
jgi:O-antigen/teichoic acid export membrane protein